MSNPFMKRISSVAFLMLLAVFSEDRAYGQSLYASEINGIRERTRVAIEVYKAQIQTLATRQIYWKRFYSEMELFNLLHSSLVQEMKAPNWQSEFQKLERPLDQLKFLIRLETQLERGRDHFEEIRTWMKAEAVLVKQQIAHDAPLTEVFDAELKESEANLDAGVRWIEDGLSVVRKSVQNYQDYRARLHKAQIFKDLDKHKFRLWMTSQIGHLRNASVALRVKVLEYLRVQSREKARIHIVALSRIEEIARELEVESPLEIADAEIHNREDFDALYADIDETRRALVTAWNKTAPKAGVKKASADLVISPMVAFRGEATRQPAFGADFQDPQNQTRAEDEAIINTDASEPKSCVESKVKSPSGKDYDIQNSSQDSKSVAEYQSKDPSGPDPELGSDGFMSIHDYELRGYAKFNNGDTLGNELQNHLGEVVRQKDVGKTPDDFDSFASQDDNYDPPPYPQEKESPPQADKSPQNNPFAGPLEKVERMVREAHSKAVAAQARELEALLGEIERATRVENFYRTTTENLAKSAERSRSLPLANLSGLGAGPAFREAYPKPESDLTFADAAGFALGFAPGYDLTEFFKGVVTGKNLFGKPVSETEVAIQAGFAALSLMPGASKAGKIAYQNFGKSASKVKGVAKTLPPNTRNFLNRRAGGLALGGNNGVAREMSEAEVTKLADLHMGLGKKISGIKGKDLGNVIAHRAHPKSDFVSDAGDLFSKNSGWRDANLRASHRFSQPGDGGLYGSIGDDAAETARKEARSSDGLVEGAQEVPVKNALDLTDPEVLKQLGVDEEDLFRNLDSFPDAYDLTQVLGDLARENGFDSIIFRSAEHKNGRNIILLDW